MPARLRSLPLWIAVIAGALWSSSRDAVTQSSTPPYGVSDLGTIGGAPVVPLAVDDGAFPWIFGSGATSSGDLHAFGGNVYGPLHDLGTLGGRASEARA